MPSPQPGKPKDPRPPRTEPLEEINYFEIDFGPQLTPEQRTWPVISLDRPRRRPTAEAPQKGATPPAAAPEPGSPPPSE